jgi:acyl-CoA thioesterase
MTTIHELMQGDQFAKLAQMELVSATPGHAVARMPVLPCHLNGLKSIQGGVVFTLADFAFAAASNAHGAPAVAINVSITFMKAVNSGVLTAEARELSRNSKLGTYTVNVTDEPGNLIAVFQGLAYYKRPAGSAPAA